MFLFLCLWAHMSALCIYLAQKRTRKVHNCSLSSLRMFKIIRERRNVRVPLPLGVYLSTLYLGWKASKSRNLPRMSLFWPTAVQNQHSHSCILLFFSDAEHIYRLFVCVWLRNFNSDLAVWYLKTKGKNRKAGFFLPFLGIYISTSNIVGSKS